LAREPYGYYTGLRWAVAIIAVISAFDAYRKEKVPWAWVFGGIMISFNPIVPIYLIRGMWTPIDIVATIIFLVSIFAVKCKEE
jgi:hypothetical protein